MTGTYYEIVVKGRLGTALRHWFASVDVVATGPEGTHLYGWFVDQAELRALINELRDLGVEIRSVEQVPPRP